MRVLICDQESEMLERIARTFEVDVATSKATCVDLMRANPFDVLVASERLSDGSGLELLSHVATRWPDTLRVLVIEPARLKLIRGKLGPFKLDATLKYPIDEDELEAVLDRLQGRLAQAAESDEEDERDPGELTSDAGSMRGSRGSHSASLETAATQAMKVTKAQLTQRVKECSSASGSGVTPQVARAAAAATGGSRMHGAASGGLNPMSRNSNPVSRSSGKAIAAAGAAKPTALAARPLGTPRSDPPPVKRRLGNYTPLGSPDDVPMRIVEREFDHSAAPLASRAIRTREEAARPRTPAEKAKLLAAQLSNRLKRLLKR